MTESDLETVVARSGHERYRWLTSDDNPDVESREGYRRIVREMAGSPTPYPSLIAQAGNAAKAAVRFVASGGETVDQAEYDRRRAICAACEHFDADQNRCRRCGCRTEFKLRAATEACPLDPPRW